MKFRTKTFNDCNTNFLAMYILSIMIFGLTVGIVWHTDYEYKDKTILALPLAWFALFTFLFWAKYVAESQARRIAVFGKHFAIMTPETARDHKFTYFVEDERGRQLIMTECVNMKEIHIVRSEFAPLLPKLFYTHLIRDLRSHGSRCKINIDNINHVTLDFINP